MMTESQKNIAPEDETNSAATKQSDNKNKATKTKASGSPPKSNPAISTPQTKSGPRLISFAALILAIGASVAGYTLWQQLNSQQADLTSRLSNTEKTITGFASSITAAESSSTSSLTLSQSIESSNKKLQSQLQTLELKIDSGLSKLEQSDQSLNESLTTISKKTQQNKDANWLVAEARHLITIANYQSQLNHNSATASAALETADQRRLGFLSGIDASPGMRVVASQTANWERARAYTHYVLSALQHPPSIAHSRDIYFIFDPPITWGIDSELVH